LYSIILTNEKGVRSYIYILKIFEKININEIYNEKENKSNNSMNRDNLKNNENLKILNTLDLDENKIENQLINNNT